MEVMSHEFGHAYYMATHLAKYFEFKEALFKNHNMRADGHKGNDPSEVYARYWQNYGKPLLKAKKIE